MMHGFTWRYLTVDVCVFCSRACTLKGLFPTVIPTLPQFLGFASYPDESSINLGRKVSHSAHRPQRTSCVAKPTAQAPQHSSKPPSEAQTRRKQHKQDNYRYSKLNSCSGDDYDDCAGATGGGGIAGVESCTSLALPPSVVRLPSAQAGFGVSSAGGATAAAQKQPQQQKRKARESRAQPAYV